MTEIANKFPPMSGKSTETVTNSRENETKLNVAGMFSDSHRLDQLENTMSSFSQQISTISNFFNESTRHVPLPEQQDDMLSLHGGEISQNEDSDSETLLNAALTSHKEKPNINNLFTQDDKTDKKYCPFSSG